MSVASTSIENYHQHRDSGRLGKQQQLILDGMRGGESYSRRELAAHLGLELSSICGRVNELVASGYLEELPTRRCSVTGKSVHPVAKTTKALF